MTSSWPVDVLGHGAVTLGRSVTCDGFERDYSHRAQTHTHVDHTADLKKSKRGQDMVMTTATKELLILDGHDDFSTPRNNLFALNYHEPFPFEGGEIKLIPSGHVLGAAQVEVTCHELGLKLGYSGDFAWPLNETVQVDYLVLDSMNGNFRFRRNYNQEYVEERFRELFANKIREGPVTIKARRGTLERACSLLHDVTSIPIIAPLSTKREIDVYRNFGYSIGDVYAVNTEEARRIVTTREFVNLTSLRSDHPDSPVLGTTIILDAYQAGPNDPVQELNARTFRIAMSNHADFDGILEYVRETGARYVLTDNVRQGSPIDLAEAIRDRLHIESRPSEHSPGRRW